MLKKDGKHIGYKKLEVCSLICSGGLMKVIIGNDAGNTFQIELGEDGADFLKGKKIGETFSGDALDLEGYKIKITGGSDKNGFPMRKGIQSTGRTKKILKDGTGITKPKNGVRRRKTVRGEILSDSIEQVNCQVVEKGEEDLKNLLGPSEEEGDQSGE